MSKLALHNIVEKDPNQEMSLQNETESKKSREWRPTVRIKERQQKFRQKLSISDLYPDRNYIKEVNESEGRYFLLLIIPVVVTALYNAISRQDLFNKMVAFFVGFFGH